jgi:cobyrinic acid a,c-diamide synthase
MRGLVVAGTASGVGKTVATLTMIEAFQQEGKSVQPTKAGPDFIDPSHHEAVAGVPSRTLDLWLQGEAGLRRNYWRGDGDICLVEGVMGMYDGDGSSTAMVAEALDLPVVLVVDAKAGMESVAATALGFREYAATAGRDVDVAGVVAQRCHGGRHERGIRDALPDGIEFLGRIPPQSGLEIPDRHLGLAMGDESPVDADALASAAESLDVSALLDVGREPPEPGPVQPGPVTEARVAVAQDEAFCFTYAATLERLRERAEVVAFSPVAGDDLPEADGIYLPGGYPELHAEALEESPALDTLANRAADGLPVYGECGGMMALAESLTTSDGGTFEMAGILPAAVEMADRYQALDHVELVGSRASPVASPGDRLRGHEFHYSRAEVDSDATFAFDVERGSGIDDARDGLLEYRTLGTYCHCHPASGAFDQFLERV